jgi:hypothetical protein
MSMVERNPRTRVPAGGVKEALKSNVKRQQKRAPVTASPGTSTAKKAAAKRRAASADRSR